ncbi:MAG: flavodoxin domain-containing protein [Candidatus Schekmanbacteria bacterium]|nr:flavodoxin domain-containing protein [Candidatus Schekmanbacteria bacterium]
MSKILITYYSRTGNTAKMAQLIAEGAAATGVNVDVRPVTEMEPEDLLNYDAIVAGSPTYYGMMAYELKRLFDASVKFHGKLDGKIGAAFASSANIGGGNETTILGILQIFLVHGMIVQGLPKGDHYGPVSIGTPDERASKQCKELGARVAKLAGMLEKLG